VKIKSKLKEVSIKTAVFSKGITAHGIKLKKKTKPGAAMNKKRLVLDGIIVSLTINFKPSAIGCSKPNQPTTFGPTRRCIEAINLRSANVKKATAPKRGKIISKLKVKLSITK
jgi:hypothetical protein